MKRVAIQLITLFLSAVALSAQDYPQVVTFETSDAESATFTSLGVASKSKDVAKIALEYNYPVWHILHQDYPDCMWEDLGRKFGLATVCSIDL